MQQKIHDFIAGPPGWLIAIAMIAAAICVAEFLHAVTQRILHRLVAQASPWHRFVVRTRNLRRSLFFLIAINVAAQLPFVPDNISAFAAQFLRASAFLVIGWTAIIGVDIASSFYLRRFDLKESNNLTARKHYTQVRVLMRAVQILIGVVAVAASLMTFETVRSFGVSLFASAGVAGLAVGLAARPLLANLIAGVQLAMTQPIRIDDAVVVENEWGWIEQITSTYVVIKLWDWRRLIVPLSYFMEKPFQNWTRDTASIIGTVFLYTDYTVPVEAVRKKLSEIAERSALWDKQVVNLQVTEMDDKAVQLRALVSAATAPQAWDLRCEVREKLLAFLQAEYPCALPHHRLEGMRVAEDGPRMHR